MNRIVVVTGSRDWNDIALIREAMQDLSKDTIIFHGGAAGVDTMAGHCAKQLEMPQMVMPYFGWLGYGGGPVRNKMMIDVIRGLVAARWSVSALAFSHNNSRGTADMIQRLTKADIPVKVCRQ